MFITPINSSPVSFKHKWIVKTLYKQGKLPSVTKGLYGDILTIENVSVEHLRPLSKGGRTVLNNLALASVAKNNLRSNHDITQYLTPEKATQYLEQFKDVKVKRFSGNNYIKCIVETLKKLGLDISSFIK